MNTLDPALREQLCAWMDGELPASLGQGLLSGLAHPVIGLDHLAFIVAAGLIAGAAGLGLLLGRAHLGADGRLEPRRPGADPRPG